MKLTKVLLAGFILTLSAGGGAGASICISPQGSDKNPGTADQPVQTLNRLAALIAESSNVTEVVFQGGTYYGSFTVSGPPNLAAAQLSPLVIRPVEGATVILDGARPLQSAEPVEGWPGVYVVTNPIHFRSELHRTRGSFPQVWDAQSRKRYQLAADPQAVRRFPASFCFTRDAFYVHTQDGQPPSANNLEVSMLDVAKHGMNISRPNVTVRGLWCRNFFADPINTAGFGLRGENVAVEDCRASNCPRGFGMYGPRQRISRCRADDCGCGVHVKEKNALVENSRFVKVRDSFMVPIASQEDTGIEAYYPAGANVVLRGNVCKGFGYCGIFIKCDPGEFLVENNTLVDNTTGIGWSGAHLDRIVACRRNIIRGSRNPFSLGGHEFITSKSLALEDNCIWTAPWGNPDDLKASLAYANTRGKGNFMADPRLAAPEANVFKLLTNSPCLGRGAKGANIGAEGAVAADFKDSCPPLVKLSEQPALARLNAEAGEAPMFLATNRTFQLRIGAHDSVSRPAEMKILIGGAEWSAARPYAETHTVQLPAESRTVQVSVRVADAQGNWSGPESIQVQSRLKAPAFAGRPVVRANSHGAVISFRSDVECWAEGEFGPDNKYGAPLRVGNAAAQGEQGAAGREHVMGFVLPRPEPGKRYCYKIRLADGQGGQGEAIEGDVLLAGEAREWHVQTDGEDAEARGSAAAPWRTMQYAVDRALPGDSVILKTGLYTGHTLLTRGGTEAAPLVIKAEKAGAVVLDGNRAVNSLLRLVEAPHVQISGIEFRWYGKPYGWGVIIEKSPHVSLRECKIWNAFWNEGRASGIGLEATDSPNLTLERNLIFRNDRPFRLFRCPSSRVVYNTIRGHVHGGPYFYQSLAGTVLRNNDLTYNGNDICAFIIVDPQEMETFDSDYNNLGTCLRAWRDEPGVVPNLPRQPGGSKAVMMFVRSGGTWLGNGPTARQWVADKDTPPEKRGNRYFRLRTFEDWKTFSGKDRHSIFADPRYHDFMEMDFRLMPGSPNIGAGENGTTIGAMEVYEGPAAQAGPKQ